MKNIKESNEHVKVIIENVVFLQGDDFAQYEQDEPPNDLDYLLQWYYPNEHMTEEHYARDINTPFLGKLIKIDGYPGFWLFSKDIRIGYIGLSRIIEFRHE